MVQTFTPCMQVFNLLLYKRSGIECVLTDTTYV